MSDHRPFDGSNPLRDRLLAALFPRIGEDFLANVALLARVEQVKLADVATMIQAGRHMELARTLSERIGVPDLLDASAKAFVLPEKYRKNHDALVARLYRLSR